LTAAGSQHLQGQTAMTEDEFVQMLADVSLFSMVDR
jgi:hypothetical protein